ncbi:hypothetical protein HOP60_14820 [Halomonas daqingensis]|uniref:Uncharacterized protein n=1 Tax=Billgrantia desiderata TaxID=52021 RepID=A0ABS9B8C4_9GAMM|nr:hypothetical protein [Halomonas desiderata]MCE8043424.1 hypothetical protein [Halomonas desiderata]MCE8047999.1 hypothetical protein [Halomonas desiderata]
MIQASKEVILPFVPKSDMNIQDGDMPSVLIKNVTWNIQKQCFLCEVEEGCQYEFNSKDNVNNLIKELVILESAREHGWFIKKQIYRAA